ncbi:MAG TPA: hypothetical protein PLR99_22860, partial [Polyangiaceae bacterium]|nr:hypothetical protein [Polyangiaceae bacterium]
MISTPRQARAPQPVPRRATAGLGLLAALCVGACWVGAAGCVGSDPSGTTPTPSATATTTTTTTSTALDGAPPPDGA